MTDPQVRLLSELAASEARIEALELDFARMVLASEASNADDEHDPEGPTIAFERQQLDAVLGNALRTRADLQSALTLYDLGRYGTCEVCDQPIAPERLEARPQATRCITCAAASR